MHDTTARSISLNRRNSPNDTETAIKILEGVKQIYGDDPETMGLLGRTYNDMYKDAKKNNDQFTSLGFLDKVIDTYTRGFYSDPRDYYPGLNAVTLLI
ncbi:MAG: TRAFs-binding domain-containing protein [Nitrososphaeraceae archaeon]